MVEQMPLCCNVNFAFLSVWVKSRRVKFNVGDVVAFLSMMMLPLHVAILLNLECKFSPSTIHVS